MMEIPKDANADFHLGVIYALSNLDLRALGINRDIEDIANGYVVDEIKAWSEHGRDLIQAQEPPGSEGSCVAHGDRYISKEQVNPAVATGFIFVCLKCVDESLNLHLSPEGAKTLRDMAFTECLGCGEMVGPGHDCPEDA